VDGADQAVPSGFERELEKVRMLGYAVDDGQTAVGIRCVAAPLFNDRGCCGAIGVSYLLGGQPSVTTVVKALMEAAGRASARLGGQGVPHP
jgi:DNA-binding IclR family transcriptional regulator